MGEGSQHALVPRDPRDAGSVAAATLGRCGGRWKASSCRCQDGGRDHVIQHRPPLATAQRPKVPLGGLGGGQVADEPKAAAGQERRNLGRRQAEPPPLARRRTPSTRRRACGNRERSPASTARST